MGTVNNFRVSGRKVREVVDAQSQALSSLGPVLRQIEARIIGCEEQIRRLTQVDTDWRSRTFWQRLRWVLRGR